MFNDLKKIPQRLYVGLGVTAIAYALFFMLTPFTCPIRAITGVPDPFCGTTRAWLAALQGNFGDAFWYHPLFLWAPLLLLVIILYMSTHKERYLFLSVVGVSTFLIIYLIRLTLFVIP